MDETIWDLTVKPFQYVAGPVGSFGVMTAGATQSWTSLAVTEMNYENCTTTPFSFSGEEVSWLELLTAVGHILGAISSWFLAENIGRKNTLCVLAILLALKWVLDLAISGPELFYVTQLIGSIAIGGFFTIVPIYMDEILDSSVNDKLSTLYNIMLAMGMLFTYCVSALTSYHGLAGVCLVLPIAYFFAMIWMPESPKSLLMRNRKTDAERALRKLRGSNPICENELQLLQADVDEESRNKGKFFGLFKSPENRKALLLSLGLIFFQQFSGFKTVKLYVGKILQDAGFNLSPNGTSIVMATGHLFSSCLSAFLVIVAGRRVLLISSNGVMALSLAGLALCSQLGVTGTVPLVCIAAFIFANSLSCGHIPTLMISEMFHAGVRSKSTALFVCLNSILEFIVNKLLQTMAVVTTSAQEYLVYFSIWVIATVVVWYYLPETKGKSPEEIRDILAVNAEAT